MFSSTAVRDGKNVCFQNRKPSGGTVYIFLNPKGFTYISEVYYEILQLQASGVASSAARDQRPLLTTTPSPVRAFRSFTNDITPVPGIGDFTVQRPVASPRRTASQRPLPLSRQWFIRHIPIFINRARQDARNNAVRQREDTRLRQGLQSFFRQ
jgi:hypothetical protein